MAQRHALHVERTAEKALILSDRVELSSAEAREEEIKGGWLIRYAGYEPGDSLLEGWILEI